MDKLYLSRIVVNGVLVDISKNQFSYYITVDNDITEVSLELESVGDGIITVNGIEYTKGMKVSIGKESIKINVTDGFRTTGYELIIRKWLGDVWMKKIVNLFLFVVILVCMLVAFGLIIFYNNQNYKTKITEVLMHDIVIVDINASM